LEISTYPVFAMSNAHQGAHNMATRYQDVPAPLKILRRCDVEARCGLGRSTIYLKMSLNEFPKQITLGNGRAVGWVESEITNWLEQQVAASRGE
jgi:prophage regulatory protein